MGPQALLFTKMEGAGEGDMYSPQGGYAYSYPHHAGIMLGGGEGQEIVWLGSAAQLSAEDAATHHLANGGSLSLAADAEIASNPEDLMLEEDQGEDGEWVLVGNAGLHALLDGEEAEVLKKLARIVGTIELRMEWGSQTQV